MSADTVVQILFNCCVLTTQEIGDEKHKHIVGDDIVVGDVDGIFFSVV